MVHEVVINQLNFFDLLDPETRIVVQQEDKEFDKNMGDAGSSFLRACQNLKRIHEALRYKRPGFVEYCKTKPGLSQSTAWRMINVAKKLFNLNNIQSGATALYLLADPDTPEEALAEAIQRSEAGEEITYSIAKEIVANHTEPEPPEPLTKAEDLLPKPKVYVDMNGKEFTLPQSTESEPEDDWEQIPELVTSEYEEEPEPPPEIPNPQPSLPKPPEQITHDREVLTASGTDEHYTPPEIIAAVRQCLGSIELDPASCTTANEVVKADRFFTIQDDAMLKTWIAKTVFMNPPYSDVHKFLTRLVHSYQAGRVEQAIGLVKADTSTRWFQLIWQNASMVCFVDHRLKFYGSSEGAATFASAVAYFGPEVDRFYRAFVDFGPVVQVVNPSMFGE